MAGPFMIGSPGIDVGAGMVPGAVPFLVSRCAVFVAVSTVAASGITVGVSSWSNRCGPGGFRCRCHGRGRDCGLAPWLVGLDSSFRCGFFPAAGGQDGYSQGDGDGRGSVSSTWVLLLFFPLVPGGHGGGTVIFPPERPQPGIGFDWPSDGRFRKPLSQGVSGPNYSVVRIWYTRAWAMPRRRRSF